MSEHNSVSAEAPELVRIAAVAEYFDVTDRTVRRWMSDGMPHYRPGGPGAQPRFDLREVREWAAVNANDSDQEIP